MTIDLAPVQPAKAAVAPPVAVTRSAPAPPEQVLVSWVRGPAQCDGSVAAVATDVRPLPNATWSPALETGSTVGPVVYRFRIAPDGRTTGIARDGNRYVPASDDLAPALAATRFAAGGARTCRVVFRPAVAPFATAPLDQVHAYAVLANGPTPPATWDRVRPAGETCSGFAPAVRLRAYPDLGKVAQAPGTYGWSVTGFDIARSGRTVRVATAATSGNAMLDRRSRAALARTRYSPGDPRTGCLTPHWLRGPALAAPVPPDAEGFRPVGATCSADHGWARPPVLTYPEPFRRRAVEGWAVIGYDVAPWGEIGNVRVLAAEPSSEFGDAGVAVLRQAALPPGGQGLVGCVDRVLFKMADGSAATRRTPPIGSAR